MQTVNFVKTEDILEKIEALFSAEKQKLEAVLPHAQIEHIGATAVTGTITKGDLDINIRVELEDFGKAIEILKELYEVNQDNDQTAGFASFKDDAKDLGVQLTVLDAKEDYFVAQREYFKSHPDKVIKLNEIKKEFEGKDMNEYRKAKSAFLKLLPV